MDIAKYIGLFLLKNHFCYIHGLGNLELKKKPASHDGEALHGPSYEVMVTTGGSIDDNLANFIATNEFISISKASNALRDYSTDARAQLHDGKEVVIANIGKFNEVNGRISFTTDPNLQYTPHVMPSMRTDRRPDEVGAARPYTPPLPSMQTNAEIPEKPKTIAPPPPVYNAQSIDWKKVIIAACSLIALLVLVLVAFHYIKNRNNHQNTFTPPPQVTTPMPVTKPVADTATAMRNPDTARTYNFVIDDFTTRKKAEKKVNLMKSYGHADAQMVAQDSTMYLVILPIKCTPADTSRIIDSLSRFYAYPSVNIYP
jgi:hypothetical protein